VKLLAVADNVVVPALLLVDQVAHQNVVFQLIITVAQLVVVVEADSSITNCLGHYAILLWVMA
jgi:hypothetical protein